ncbi:MAG: hypothetical protein OCD76_12600 [Reichenbachiella sp.]
MKYILLPIVCLLLSLISFSQESAAYLKMKSKSKYNEGFLVKQDSSLIEGLIKNSVWNSAGQYAFLSFVHKDGTKEQFFPSELKGFSYEGLRFIANESSFYQEVKVGKRIGLYRSVLILPAGGGSAISTSATGSVMSTNQTSYDAGLYLRKTDEKVFKWVRERHFQLLFSKYFEDCPSLYEKVMNGEIMYRDIDQMMELYEDCE